jgi:hypothetical protein
LAATVAAISALAERSCLARPGFPVEEAFEVERDIGEVDLALARSMPMVRMNRPKRCFWVANTCSTAERTLERAALALCGLLGALRKWIGPPRVAGW